MVEWPDDAAGREALCAARVPRLLVVRDGGPPPDVADPLEDWVRLPADDADVRARVSTLGRRASDAPSLDADVLRFGGASVVLSPLEGRLAGALVARFGRVVHRDVLAAAGWPGGLRGRNSLDVHVLRVRRRVATVGLALTTVRCRGYLLEAAR